MKKQFVNSFDPLVTDKYIIFPYDRNGELIDINLSQYSGIKEYLIDNYDLIVPKQISGKSDGRDVPNANYGGGVLEILPKEAENIIIPNIDDMDEQNVNRLIGLLDDNIRNKKDIRDAIKVMDKEILENYLGISADTINMYREIWKTLNDRRMNRK